MDTTCYKEFNGEKLFCRHMKPKRGNDPKCLVYICHGFGEHMGLYDELFDLMSSEGIYIFGNDHYGHGKSSGYRAWVPNYDVFTLPCKLHIEETAKHYPGKKVFVYGHSMGGLIAVRLLHQYDTISHGLILEAPFLEKPNTYPSWMVSLGAFLGRFWLISSLPLGSTGLEIMTHDVELIEKYRQDPLTYIGPANLRFVTSSMDAMTEAVNEAKRIQVPILIQHGEDDRTCPVAGSRQLFNIIGSTDKILKVYEEGFHLLRNEPHRDIKHKFLKDLFEWLNARC